MTPILIITRPNGPDAPFARAVLNALGEDVPVIFAPAFSIVPLPAKVPADIAHLIFTSVNGVAQADRLKLPRVTAWCVGDRTAEAACAAGFHAQSAGGDADALVEVILDHAPIGRLVHVAGLEALGDVAARLSAGGLSAQTIHAYRQQPCDPSDALVAASRGTNPAVAPVFSARSAAILAGLDWHGALNGVAISGNVAEVLADIGCDTVQTVKRPTEEVMIEGTVMVLRALLDR